MADEIEKAAGSGITVTIDGEDYEIGPPRIADYLALKKFMRSNRIAEFREAAGDMDARERMQIIKDLVSEPIPQDDLEAELRTAEGSRFMLWRVLRRTRPELTLEKLDELMESDDVRFDDEDLQTMMAELGTGEPDGTTQEGGGSDPTAGTS